MAFFTQQSCATLYLGPMGADDAGSVAFVPLFKDAEGPPGLDLKQALTDQELLGSFVFCPKPLDFGGDADAQATFTDAVRAAAQGYATRRGIVWIPEPGSLSAAEDDPPPLQFPALSLQADGRSAGTFGVTVSTTLTITMSASTLAADETELRISGISGQPLLLYSGSSAPTASMVSTARLPFAGPRRGCILHETFLLRESLIRRWQMGFQFVFRNPESPQGLISEWLPLSPIDGTAGDMIGFRASLDPLDIYCRALPARTAFSFTGRNQDGTRTVLASYYRTATGDAVTLYPVGTEDMPETFLAAGLVFDAGQRLSDELDSFLTGPIGDFLVSAPPGPDGETASLLCGLEGTECLTFVPGEEATTASRLRFVPGMGAYVKQFPPPQASPLAAPNDPTAPLMENLFATSWATMLPPPSGGAVAYVAQPKGFSLFGVDTILAPEFTSVLGAVEPALVLPPEDAPLFPLPCYAGARPGDGIKSFSAAQMKDFETLVVGPSRRAAIAAAEPERHVCARSAAANRPHALTAGGGSQTVTTPSGVLATLEANGDWSEIRLGQTVSPTATALAFKQPTETLQGAFQTSQLFLVMANANEVVRPGGHFANRVTIGGWEIEADIGASPGYGDYSNVMIVKGIPGPLYDPEGDPKENLIGNAEKWTQAATFAEPTIDGKPTGQSQLVALSQWLQDYFAAAAKDPDTDFFGPFNAIASDPAWTGILILRARIAAPPEDIIGVLAGVRDPSRFYAHHLSIASSHITYDAASGGIGIDEQSAIQGLIYYCDPDYNAAKGDQPVTPKLGVDYDFTLLTLKVLFENTAVKLFYSRAQLVLNSLFGSRVTGMGPGGNSLNAILLDGAFQNNNGTPSYSLGTVGEQWFTFDSNIFNKVEVDSVQLTTRDADSAGKVASVFTMAGFLDFKTLATGGEPATIDLFSFGSPADGALQPRAGLAYNTLRLNMEFSQSDPSDAAIAFDASAVAFNLQTSTPRPGSLFTSLGLELKGLVQGASADDSPARKGYLDVVTDARLGGVGEAWNGLRFRLNLGTPGALAGAVGLNAYLLLAWSPDSAGESYRARAAVQMPGSNQGAPLISLQTVLSLSYGTIQLLYRPKPTGEGHQYMFVLNEIALKFLGLLKVPPSGATAFYLFGDAQGSAAQSGLGWYAAYNNEPKPAKAPLLPPPPSSPET